MFNGNKVPFNRSVIIGIRVAGYYYADEQVGKLSSLTKFIAAAFFLPAQNCENNKNTDFDTLFLVLQQRENKRKLADVNVNKR
jgi:hypothetical protein